jgi:hypothetical protein
MCGDLWWGFCFAAISFDDTDHGWISSSPEKSKKRKAERVICVTIV